MCEEWVPTEFELEGKMGGTRLRSSIDADHFIKSGKIKLEFMKKKIESPAFIHFEFDN